LWSSPEALSRRSFAGITTFAIVLGYAYVWIALGGLSLLQKRGAIRR
jgi:hypothetical protein